MADNMPTLRNDLAQVARKARLTSAVADVDRIIDRLLEAREKIAADQDPHAASLVLTRLQNPIKEAFETVNDDLKAVSKTQREFGKALDRSFPVTALPTDHDVMADHSALINRAIAMHLLREGHFGAAGVFMDEARSELERGDKGPSSTSRTAQTNGGGGGGGGSDGDGDLHDTDMANGDNSSTTSSSGSSSKDGSDVSGHSVTNFTHAESLYLRDKFQSMYSILQDIKAHDLTSAIAWARTNSLALEARGSNLEFELCKLQYVWLAKSSATGGAAAGPAAPADLSAAFQYAREHFGRFRDRHLAEIQRLAAALVFSSNIGASPYATVFETATAFEEVATAFTREFCSLLGLSAESPLYVAAKAGVVALPRLIKFIGATRSKRTEWTTADEMAFETPLPASMTYHSIFVCPVSKEQTTEANPPMRLPCGHVLAHDSLQNLAKGSKFKCPYCPVEGHLRDARQIIL